MEEAFDLSFDRLLMMMMMMYAESENIETHPQNIPIHIKKNLLL